MFKLMKRNIYVVTFIIILIILCFVIIRSKILKNRNNEFINQKDEEVVFDTIINNDNNDSKKNDEVDNKNLKVDIKGQVVNPGVYELSNNSRVIDVINMAGGLTDIANTSLINLSKKIEDQMVIIIYSDDEVMNSNVKEIETVFKVVEKECVCPVIKNDGCINTELDNNINDDSDVISNKININTASLEELMTLTGVGESKAKSIIEYREKSKFTSIEDIMNVSGIGELAFEKIKEYITV